MKYSHTILSIIVFVCLALGGTSCQLGAKINTGEPRLDVDNGSTSTEPAFFTPTPSLTNTETPTPSKTPQPTETPLPTMTLTPTPCATFEVSSLLVSYPCHWEKESKTRYSGADGFVEIELLPMQTNPSNVCELLAFQYPERFGEDAIIVPYFGNDCLIFTQNESVVTSNLQAAYVTLLNEPIDNHNMAVLWVMNDDLYKKVKVLSKPTWHQNFYFDAQEVNTPEAGNVSIALEGRFGDISYEEVLVTSDAVLADPNDRVQWWSSNATNYAEFDEEQLQLTNEKLAQFGYRLELKEFGDWDVKYTLSKDGQVLLHAVNWFWFMPLSINQSGDDFVLPVLQGSTCRIVSDGQVEVLDRKDFRGCWFAPFYIGDQLVTLQFTKDTFKVNVVIDGEIALPLNINKFGPAFYPSPMWLSEYQDHWVMELNDKVIIDGEMLNLSIGADEIFNWRLLSGKPFYFYRQMGAVYISYDGQSLPLSYDYVEHYNRSCCALTRAQYNIYNTPDSVSFLAQKDGVWYVVKLHIEGE